MPSLRTPIPATRHVKHLRLRGRIYSSVFDKPFYIPIETQVVDSHRFPLVEGVFTDFDIQRHIHDTMVVVHEGSARHTFRLFIKNHCQMRVNPAVAALGRNRVWRGDIVVMRAGSLVDGSVVNMRGRDSGLADFVVRKFVKRVRQKTPLILPKNLQFYKR